MFPNVGMWELLCSGKNYINPIIENISKLPYFVKSMIESFSLCM